MSTPSPPLLQRTLKVCGAKSTRDIEVLAGAGADLVGLWHGVPGGPADLPEHEVAALAAATRATGTPHPVLVTFLGDTDALAGVLRRTGITTVQLHAYQRPSTVRALRTALPDTVIVKVLHVSGGTCPEHTLLGAYERAGTDLFLIDATTADGRVGSTGQRLDEDTVLGLAERFTLPFWLAGGLTRANRSAYERVLRHPRLRGIDVDTAARGRDGRFAAPAVTGLARAWDTGPSRPDLRSAPGPGTRSGRTAPPRGYTPHEGDGPAHREHAPPSSQLRSHGGAHDAPHSCTQIPTTRPTEQP